MRVVLFLALVLREDLRLAVVFRVGDFLLTEGVAGGL